MESCDTWEDWQKQSNWKWVRGSLTNGKNEKMSFRPVRWEIWEEAWDKWRSRVAGVEGKTQQWPELIWEGEGRLSGVDTERWSNVFVFKRHLDRWQVKSKFTVVFKAGKMFFYLPVCHLISLSLSVCLYLSECQSVCSTFFSFRCQNWCLVKSMSLKHRGIA